MDVCCGIVGDDVMVILDLYNFWFLRFLYMVFFSGCFVFYGNVCD